MIKMRVLVNDEFEIDVERSWPISTMFHMIWEETGYPFLAQRMLLNLGHEVMEIAYSDTPIATLGTSVDLRVEMTEQLGYGTSLYIECSQIAAEIEKQPAPYFGPVSDFCMDKPLSYAINQPRAMEMLLGSGENPNSFLSGGFNALIHSFHWRASDPELLVMGGTDFFTTCLDQICVILIHTGGPSFEEAGALIESGMRVSFEEQEPTDEQVKGYGELVQIVDKGTIIPVPLLNKLGRNYLNRSDIPHDLEERARILHICGSLNLV